MSRYSILSCLAPSLQASPLARLAAQDPSPLAKVLMGSLEDQKEETVLFVADGSVSQWVKDLN